MQTSVIQVRITAAPPLMSTAPSPVLTVPHVSVWQLSATSPSVRWSLRSRQPVLPPWDPPMKMTPQDTLQALASTQSRPSTRRQWQRHATQSLCILFWPFVTCWLAWPRRSSVASRTTPYISSGWLHISINLTVAICTCSNKLAVYWPGSQMAGSF